uniref:WEB family protein n=1 Tax=Aegilops tauschii subsp. strangulata TaxID=200361 RepID=A0A452YQP2_AEGTS
MEILMAEVARLKSETESREKGAEEIIDKLRSEASELRAELQRAMAFQEKLVRAEEVVEGLKVDIAYAKRAEIDADQSAQGWKTKAAALEDRLVAITSLNKSNEEALASLTKSFKEAQSQLLQLTEKAAASEGEASEYKEGFLETNRRLDIVRKEASELQATIDRLRFEHELLNETHRQVVGNEKAASSQVGVLGGDKVRLQQELDEAREERNKAKKGVEDVAAALRQVSAEAREAKERVLAKQIELDHAQLQISEMKTATKTAEDKYQLMLQESNCLKKKVERLGSEAKTLQDDRVSKEVGFAEMLRRSEEEASYVKSEMSKLMESLAVAEKEVQELKAEKTQLVHQLEEGFNRTMMDAASSSAEQPMVTESSHLKDLLSTKEKEVLALNHQVTELRLREAAALAKADKASKSAEKSNTLLVKLEMDTMLQSQRAAEHEAKDAKDNMVQLQSKLRLVESKITEANLTAEEEKISSLRLKETLAEKEEELQSIARENDGLRTREAAARAKADELAAMLVEATAMKGGDQSAGRSPEKQPNVFRKMMCSPMDNAARGDHQDRRNSDRIVQVLEEIKHVEVETVRQAKHEREEVSVEANSMENSKILEDDLCKGMMSNGVDTESSDDDDIDSQGEDGAADQMGGLLMHGPRSSFKQEHHSHKKKKKALLRKFGSMLKKKAHFTKLNKHS